MSNSLVVLASWSANNYLGVSPAELNAVLATAFSTGQITKERFYEIQNEYNAAQLSVITGAAIAGNPLLSSRVTVQQAQLMVAQLDILIAEAEAVKAGSSTDAELMDTLLQVSAKLQEYATSGQITVPQMVKLLCAIDQMKSKIVASNGGKSEPSTLSRIILTLALLVPALIAFYALGDRKNTETILGAMRDVAMVAMYGAGIVIVGGFVYWSLVTLSENDWDIGKSVSSMVSTIITEIVEAVGDTLVTLVKDLWSGATDLAVDSTTGAPKWYDLVSPVLSLAYVYDVVSGKAPNPFDGGSSCRSVGDLRAVLQAIIAAKTGEAASTLGVAKTAPAVTYSTKTVDMRLVKPSTTKYIIQ